MVKKKKYTDSNIFSYALIGDERNKQGVVSRNLPRYQIG